MTESNSPAVRHVLTGPHPTYPKPTIVQVTCEIAFTSGPGDRLSAGNLFPSFAAEFPEILPIGTGTIQFVVGQVPFLPEALPEQQAATAAFRFSSSDERRFVQLSKTSFVYQSHDVYAGWAAFSKKLMELWDLAADKLNPGPIVKVGLRYVNRIPKSQEHPLVSDWIVATPDVPESLLTSKDHFLARIESSPASGHLKLVTIANAIPSAEAPAGAIMLDIDRVSTEQFDVSRNDISEKLELLHEDIWSVFNDACTDLLRDRLSGKL